MRRSFLVGLVVLVMLALAGCETFAKMTSFMTEVQEAGYENVQVNQDTSVGEDVVVVEVVTPDTTSTPEEHADRLVELVWTEYPFSFEEVRIAVNGAMVLEATADDLRTRFGERPEDLATEGDDGVNVGAVIALVVVALLIAGLVLTVWWRGRRPPPPVVPPAYPQPPNPYPHPPQPQQWP
jgi:hypothetical protein